MQLTIHTDGGARGNPGIAGGGVVALDQDKTEVFAGSFPFGTKTNNESEYMAVIEALKWLGAFSDKEQVDQVEFVLDSKLVVEQLSQHWKIKEPRLQQLASECWQLIKSFSFPINFSHVKRHDNARADLLANQAMDELSLAD